MSEIDEPAMTLKQVQDILRTRQLYELMIPSHLANQMADAIDAHLGISQAASMANDMAAVLSEMRKWLSHSGFNSHTLREWADRIEKSLAPQPPAPNAKRTQSNQHSYEPNKKYPWFCGKCGYSEHEPWHLPKR